MYVHKVLNLSQTFLKDQVKENHENYGFEIKSIYIKNHTRNTIHLNLVQIRSTTVPNYPISQIFFRTQYNPIFQIDHGYRI